MAEPSKSRLPVYILIGAALGLIAGLVVGERAAVLQPLGIAYAKLLEIAVFPISSVRCWSASAGWRASGQGACFGRAGRSISWCGGSPSSPSS